MLSRRSEIVSTLWAVARTRRPWINQDRVRAAQAGGNGRGPLEESSRARAWPMPRDYGCDRGHISGDRKSWLDGKKTTAFPFESVILISAYECVMAAGNVV